MASMENLKSKYLAFVLTPKSRADLLKMFPPQFERVLCHHVTLSFNVSPSDVEKFFGKAVVARVVGLARKDGVECLAVSINQDRFRSDGSFYHVTMSLAPGKKPVDSNKLANDIDFVKGVIPIYGTVELLNK